jgi:hypothetical protein
MFSQRFCLSVRRMADHRFGMAFGEHRERTAAADEVCANGDAMVPPELGDEHVEQTGIRHARRRCQRQSGLGR